MGSLDRAQASVAPAFRSPRRRADGRGCAHEEGFTLIEMLVVLAGVVGIFGATLSLLISGMHAQTASQTRVSQLQEDQVAVQRLVHDLREASTVTVTSSTAVSYTEPVSGGSVVVTFTCSGSVCTRTPANGSSYRAITDVANTDIFTGSPSASQPTYVGVKLVIAATGRSNVTLIDGAGLRNVTLGN